MVKSKTVSSVEEKVEDYFKKQLDGYKVKYYNKTDSINTSIDGALANYSSKSGGTGNNYPDIKVLLTTKNMQTIPVMIEAKGRQGDLIKYSKDSDKIDLSTKSVQKYAVNGAVHYAMALLEGHACTECLAVGINGYLKEDQTLQTEVAVYYLSLKKFCYPLKIGDFDDLSFLKQSNLDALKKKLHELDLTPEELEKLKLTKEDELEQKIQQIHQEIYDNSTLKTALQTNQKLYVFCGLIMAALSIDGQQDLEENDFKGNISGNQTDNKIVLDRVRSFLESKNNPKEKTELIMHELSVVFNTECLWKPKNGESYIKVLYKKIKDNIIPCLLSELHLDFTGKIFSKLNDWVKIDNDKQNDVVLTPRYLTSFMAKLARTNKDSYVWDSAMGSAGFLVSAMEIMVNDAKENILDQDKLEQKIRDIKQKQILGIEILPNIYILAVLNMILMGDGSSHLIQNDSRVYDIDDTSHQFPATVFLLNPPYSAIDKGLGFVSRAVSKMTKGYACVLIQENAGSGNGVTSAKEILKTSTLVASIHLSEKIFIGKASVQTAIYLFEVNKPHDLDSLVAFIDMSNDGYSRQARKKSSQSVNLKDTDDAKGRYQEVLNRILHKKCETNYYCKENGNYIEDTISLEGNDWTFSQHKKIDTTPTEEDFKKTVSEYLSWKVSNILKGENVYEQE